MRLFCIDIGTGTQDILLLDTTQRVENAIQLVLPAPTILVANKIKAATMRGASVLLIGETMGGGACTQALKKHLEAGLKVYSVPSAALTFSDDLKEVSSWGIKLLAPDETYNLKVDTIIRMGDVAIDIFREVLLRWDIQLNPDVIAIAVLDHGTAPRGESQRLSRFRHLERLLKKQNNGLKSFIFTPVDLLECFTRMQAVLRSIDMEIPKVILDTGAAAVLGASLDSTVASHPHRLAVNLGNSHTIAFLLTGSKVLGLFEHHTERLSMTRLEMFLERLVSGKLRPMEIWEDGGHGSLIMGKGSNPFLVATGPRRSLLASSRLNPYFAAPFGNMMLTGCFGLTKAVSIRFPEWRDEIERALFTACPNL